MHEDDTAAELRLLLHDGELVEHAVADFVRRFAGMLIPVAGVDLVADDGVAIALDAVGGFGLIVCVRLFINVVGRAEVERLDAEFTGEEALRQLSSR